MSALWTGRCTVLSWFLCLATAQGQQAGSSHIWPAFKGGPSYAGVAHVKARPLVSPRIKEATTIPLSHWITASPVIDAEGHAYIGTNPRPALVSRRFYDIDIADGSKRSVQLPAAGSRRPLGFRMAAAVTRNGLIIAYDGTGGQGDSSEPTGATVYCLEPRTLRVLARCNLDDVLGHKGIQGFTHVGTDVVHGEQIIYVGTEKFPARPAAVGKRTSPPLPAGRPRQTALVALRLGTSKDANGQTTYALRKQWVRRFSQPINMGGVLVDPDGSHRLYVGGNAGGIWCLEPGKKGASPEPGVTWAFDLTDRNRGFGIGLFEARLESTATIASKPGKRPAGRTLYVGTCSVGGRLGERGYLCAIDLPVRSTVPSRPGNKPSVKTTSGSKLGPPSDNPTPRFVFPPVGSEAARWTSMWHSPTVVSFPGANVVFFGGMRLDRQAKGRLFALVDSGQKEVSNEMVTWVDLDCDGKAKRPIFTAAADEVDLPPNRVRYPQIATGIIAVPVPNPFVGKHHMYLLFFADNIGFLHCFRAKIISQSDKHRVTLEPAGEHWPYDLYGAEVGKTCLRPYSHEAGGQKVLAVNMPEINRSTPAVFYDDKSGSVRVVLCGYLTRWVCPRKDGKWSKWRKCGTNLASGLDGQFGGRMFSLQLSLRK